MFFIFLFRDFSLTEQMPYLKSVQELVVPVLYVPFTFMLKTMRFLAHLA